MKNLTEIAATLSHLMAEMEESAITQFNLSELTHNQLHYLETTSKLGNPNITELSAALKLSKPTVKVAIDKLMEKEYVFKVQSDEDRRSAHLHLTEKGKLINHMHNYAHKRIAEALSSKLNSEERNNLETILNKVLYD
jgi:DNA-binding MarR family transcriptional regulator